MVAIPAATPFTVPPVTPAIAVLLLLQVPPGVASLSIVVLPTHTCNTPVMGAGDGFTTSVKVIWQVVAVSVYVIVAEPVATPVTAPVTEVTEAVVGRLLLHVPPGVASVSIIVWPWHTVGLPMIVAGKGFTVTVIELLQPALRV